MGIDAAGEEVLDAGSLLLVDGDDQGRAAILAAGHNHADNCTVVLRNVHNGLDVVVVH